jgi:hypothetical protein
MIIHDKLGKTFKVRFPQENHKKKKKSQDRQFPGWDMNLGPPKYKAGMLNHYTVTHALYIGPLRVHHQHNFKHYC